MTWKVQDVTRGDLDTALMWINEFFGENIKFMDFREIEENEFWFQLRTISADGPGHMIANPLDKIRIPTACFHVKTALYLELPDEAKLFTGKHWLERTDDYFPPWKVRNLYPVESLCECEGPLRSYRQRRQSQPNFTFVRIKGLRGKQ